MKGFYADLERDTLENDNFRKVIFTGTKSQLVLMSLLPLQEIGNEVHEEHDQFIRIEEGVGKATIGEDVFNLKDGSAIVIPAGAWHNITNTSEHDPMKLYTLYAPPQHPEGTVQKEKPIND
jgi:mannose-6-phosphate isomerase-like protein (cupin superfamily)